MSTGETAKHCLQGSAITRLHTRSAWHQPDPGPHPHSSILLAISGVAWAVPWRPNRHSLQLVGRPCSRSCWSTRPRNLGYPPPRYTPWGRPATPWNRLCGSLQPPLVYQLWDNGFTSELEADPGASCTQNSGRSTTSHTPGDGRSFPRRRHPGPDQMLLEQQRLGMPVPALRRTPGLWTPQAGSPVWLLRADCGLGGTMGIPRGAQVTIAKRAGYHGKGSWTPELGARQSPSPS